MGGISVIKLQTGDPDFAAPEPLVEVATRALRDGHTYYGFGAGSPQLRDKFALALSAEFGDVLSREKVLIIHGAVQDFAAIVNGLVDRGNIVCCG